MKRYMLLVVSTLALLFGAGAPATEGLPPKTITVVYDNYPYKKGLTTAWGFSCLVRGWDRTILFDTGGDGRLLLANMEKMGINPRDVDYIVLSHIHGDHVGGLASLLHRHHKVTVVIPPSFPLDFKEGIVRSGALLQEAEGFTELCRGVYSTGEMGNWIKEQSLVLRTAQGLIVITGCAHPGVVQIVEAIKVHVKEDILLVMGGFHLTGKAQKEIQGIVAKLRALGVKNVGPCHCSGESARKLFQETYGTAFVPVGVGMEIRIDELQ
jgi:7,8-dihydropterin-6-yl-methyl-4-(beta-D-ribofuranosyl)aminobenzene 5'-phosphate synthase